MPAKTKKSSVVKRAFERSDPVAGMGQAPMTQ
jgi:hypothetical protein